MKISPLYTDNDFPSPLKLEDKIKIFSDRILNWKLNVADMMINGGTNTEIKSNIEPIPNSGLASLDILFSYFEMIGKYEEGYAKNNNSRKYFNMGIASVFPQFKYNLPKNEGSFVPVGKTISIKDKLLDMLYKDIRCGLYHNGIVEGRIILSSKVDSSIVFDPQNATLIINPHLLVPAIKEHFRKYVERLTNPDNITLRENFERRFDYVVYQY